MIEGKRMVDIKKTMNVADLKPGDIVRLTNRDLIQIISVEHDPKNIAFPYIVVHDKSSEVGARYSRYGIKQGGDFRQGLMQVVEEKEQVKDTEMKKEEFVKALSEDKPKEVSNVTALKKVEKTKVAMPFSKSAGKPQFSTLDPKFINDLMAHMTKSKEKYPDINGEPNYYRVPENPKSDLLDPLMRHLLDVYDGKLIDEESGMPNLICCNIILNVNNIVFMLITV